MTKQHRKMIYLGTKHQRHLCVSQFDLRFPLHDAIFPNQIPEEVIVGNDRFH